MGRNIHKTYTNSAVVRVRNNCNDNGNGNDDDDDNGNDNGNGNHDDDGNGGNGDNDAVDGAATTTRSFARDAPLFIVGAVCCLCFTFIRSPITVECLYKDSDY